MKHHFFALLATSLAIAQSSTNIYTSDINGRTVDAASSVSPNGQRTELSRSVNGRQVPLQQSEEKVIRQDANGRVTERIIRKYDPNGQLASTERVVTETQKIPSGSKVRATTYRSDLNGQMQEVERTTTENVLQGAVTHADTLIERPTINGSFEPTEKRNAVIETANGTRHEDETVYRRSGNGSFVEALRRVKDEEKSADKTVDHVANYEPGMNGALQLKSQTVSTMTRRPDGAEVTEVNVYANAVDGKIQDNQAPQQIKEQQIIERVKTPGTLTETVSVRRPTVSDPTRLGNFQKISETVCKGVCTPEALQ